MSHYMESMAYRHRESSDVPWWVNSGTESMGAAVTADQSLDEWITSSKLDWKVQKRKLYMRMSADETYATTQIPNNYALCREGSKDAFQFVTDRYHILQNRELVEIFRQYCEAGDMSIETLGSLKDGAIIWCQASIGKQFRLGTNDVNKAYVFLTNSHDGSISWQGKVTDIRIVCWNTLNAAMGEGDSVFKFRHSRRITPELINDAKQKVEKACGLFEKFHETADLLSHTKVQERAMVYSYLASLNGGSFLLDSIIEEMEKSQKVQKAVATGGGLLDAIVDGQTLEAKVKLTDESFNRAGKSILDSIVDSPGSDMDSAKGTWWGVVNGVSYYTDHLAGRNADNTLQSAWFGQRSNLKDEAVQLAVKYATAN